MEPKILITRKKDGCIVVAPVGPIDTNTHESLKARIDPLLGIDTRGLVLDMEKVNYISSIGLSLVFQIKQAMNASGRPFVMVRVQPNVKRIFEAVKMLSGSFVASLKEADAYLDAYLKNVSEGGS